MLVKQQQDNFYVEKHFQQVRDQNLSQDLHNFIAVLD